MAIHFRANGKLMLTGEYLALHGAKTLAVPLQFGQDLYIEEVANPLVYWRTLFKGKIIFHAVFDTKNLEILSSNDSVKAEWINQVFVAIRKQKPEFLQNTGAEVTSVIDLPMNYGWGSSSSLIVNLSKWAQADPFQLNDETGGGSGYDIACAMADKPLIYSYKQKIPSVKLLKYDPAYKRNLWFIFQENKMNTADAIRYFRTRIPEKKDIKRINAIADEWVAAKDLDVILKLTAEHEAIMSRVLEIPSVKNQYADFDGEIKSLGAWGGDFMLAVSHWSGADVIEYFAERNRPTIFNWTEIVQYK